MVSYCIFRNITIFTIPVPSTFFDICVEIQVVVVSLQPYFVRQTTKKQIVETLRNYTQRSIYRIKRKQISLPSIVYRVDNSFLVSYLVVVARSFLLRVEIERGAYHEILIFLSRA
mmetsp:Transcript_17935/g.20083  ORF Transcript_17935/g.20083 Transcript_17935/m.20083 type:complete len:115 (+) Transcript_17935:367-711(+)